MYSAIYEVFHYTVYYKFLIISYWIEFYIHAETCLPFSFSICIDGRETDKILQLNIRLPFDSIKNRIPAIGLSRFRVVVFITLTTLETSIKHTAFYKIV